MSSANLHVALLRVLRKNVCPSDGKRKDPGKCFCKTCYFSLTRQLQLGLYVSALDGDEFYDNYLRALDRLQAIGLATPLTKFSSDSRRVIEDSGLPQALKERNASKGIT